MTSLRAAQAAAESLEALAGHRLLLSSTSGQSLNNDVWRVDAAGRSWALRIASQCSPPLLGDDAMSLIAATTPHGLAPRLVEAKPGIQLFDWIDGRVWEPADLDARGIELVARTLRRAHVPAPRGLPRLSQRIESFLAFASERGAAAPASTSAILDRIRLSEESAAILTHHDVWPNNIIDDGESLWLIDWEFAGVGDGFFDLASVAIAAGLDTDGERRLLAAYGRQDARARLAEARLEVSLFEGAWALAMSVSQRVPARFDYAAHSQAMFDRLDAESRPG